MIKNIEVKNFKAIESAKVKLTPLTAFIGYNGMGKSSLLEALQMFKSIHKEVQFFGSAGPAMVPFGS